MTALLGYLPQYEAEVGATALAVCVVGFGLFFLVRGHAPGMERLSARVVRTLACGQILVGIAIGLTGLLSDAEPPGGIPTGHWGTAWDQAVLAIWLVLLAAVTGFAIRENHK